MPIAARRPFPLCNNNKGCVLDGSFLALLLRCMTEVQDACWHLQGSLFTRRPALHRPPALSHLFCSSTVWSGCMCVLRGSVVLTCLNTAHHACCVLLLLRVGAVFHSGGLPGCVLMTHHWGCREPCWLLSTLLVFASPLSSCHYLPIAHPQGWWQSMMQQHAVHCRWV